MATQCESLFSLIRRSDLEVFVVGFRPGLDHLFVSRTSWTAIFHFCWYVSSESFILHTILTNIYAGSDMPSALSLSVEANVLLENRRTDCKLETARATVL